MLSKMIEIICKFLCRKRLKYKVIQWYLKGLIEKKFIKRGIFKEKVYVDMEIIFIKDEFGYFFIVLYVYGFFVVGGLIFVLLQ